MNLILIMICHFTTWYYILSIRLWIIISWCWFIQIDMTWLGWGLISRVNSIWVYKLLLMSCFPIIFKWGGLALAIIWWVKNINWCGFNLFYLIKLVNWNCILELRCGKVDILQYNNRGLGLSQHSWFVTFEIARLVNIRFVVCI